MASLKNDVRKYLNSLSKDKRIYFFSASNGKCSLIGSVRGVLVGILVIPTDRKSSREEIEFSARILRSQGEFFVVRSMADISEIVKIRGWI
jgi:hypothetical protein